MIIRRERTYRSNLRCHMCKTWTRASASIYYLYSACFQKGYKKTPHLSHWGQKIKNYAVGRNKTDLLKEMLHCWQQDNRPKMEFFMPNPAYPKQDSGLAYLQLWLSQKWTLKPVSRASPGQHERAHGPHSPRRPRRSGTLTQPALLTGVTAAFCSPAYNIFHLHSSLGSFLSADGMLPDSCITE